MLGSVNILRLVDGETAPQEKDDAFALLREGADCRISELFPTMMLMRTSLVCPHSESGVEQ